MKNSLSIDLEDWYHPEFVRHHIQLNPIPQIEESISSILKLFKKYDIKVTFFVLGEIAKKHSNLIKKIHANGHEIACHSMYHIPIGDLGYKRLSTDIKEFKKIIKSILGEDFNIYGFRAPTCSINENNSEYFYKCLINNNFIYDSSLVPTKFFYYGVRNTPLKIYKPNIKNLNLNDRKSKIIEVPLSITKILNLKVPICGGFYFRLIPYTLYKILLKKINSRNTPFFIYIHPWEVYPKTFRVKEMNPIKYFVTYYGIKRNLNKIERLLEDFQFDTIKNIIKNYFFDVY
ncbi:MAG: polysaccharide deacetylase family protein [Candidatus Lokiarchaeota archaeon]